MNAGAWTLNKSKRDLEVSYVPKNRDFFLVPAWAKKLNNYYWFIRTEGRNQAKRRKYYRLLELEKLRLAEQNLDQELIDAVCKYLCTAKVVCGRRMHQLMISGTKQRAFNFQYRNHL